eukprot:SAG31_NODE_1150_length_9648_cov_37.362656_10_plen_186_part_01
MLSSFLSPFPCLFLRLHLRRRMLKSMYDAPCSDACVYSCEELNSTWAETYGRHLDECTLLPQAYEDLSTRVINTCQSCTSYVSRVDNWADCWSTLPRNSLVQGQPTDQHGNSERLPKGTRFLTVGVSLEQCDRAEPAGGLTSITNSSDGANSSPGSNTMPGAISSSRNDPDAVRGGSTSTETKYVC